MEKAEVMWINDHTLDNVGVEIWVVYSLNATFNAQNQDKFGQNPTLALQVNLANHIQCMGAHQQ